MEAYFKEYDFDDCGFCKNCYVDKTYKCKKGIYIDFVDTMPVLQPIPCIHGACTAEVWGELSEEEEKAFENGKCLYYDVSHFDKDDEEE